MSPILNKLGDVWRSYPDLRLGQLVSIMGLDNDLFNIEDDVFEKNIEYFISQNNIKGN